MKKNPLLGYLMKDTKKNVVHSSAYAKAQNAGGIGTTSTESFEERQIIEANRTTIQGYKDSQLVNDAYNNSGTKAQTYDAIELAKEAAKNATLETKREQAILARQKNRLEQHAANVEKGSSGHKEITGKDEYRVRKEELAGRFGEPAKKMKQPPVWRNSGISR